MGKYMDKAKEEKIVELGKYCLEHGIDLEDLKKIFSKKETTDNIHYQRFHNLAHKKVSSGEIRIDFEEQVMHKGKQILVMHEHELLILQLLMSNVRETIKDKEILDLLEQHDHKITKESMVVYMFRLSHRIGKTMQEEEYIKRHWKKGYYWNQKINVRK